ncbi:MarR family winged helix-turn-helix transcriptional regulator [Deinococcus pimensis]|uniref:MarR family winged helix-turn-helix transcriptional regulator n=1 Tax=Deinococcus pimensis TaxID=309888 RepID=UPI000483E312|nr:MarR family winged helix-turn-helix transcriptional regulator [Deinococcus pimensis]
MNGAHPEQLDLVRRLLRLGRAMYAVLDEPMGAALGLNLKELLVLSAISSGDDSPGRIAARQHLPAPTVTRLVARLVELGLVERGGDPSDLRRSPLRLTDAGLALDARRREEAARLLAGYLAHVADDTVHDAIVALTRLEAELGAERQPQEMQRA